MEHTVGGRAESEAFLPRELGSHPPSHGRTLRSANSDDRSRHVLQAHRIVTSPSMKRFFDAVLKDAGVPSEDVPKMLKEEELASSKSEHNSIQLKLSTQTFADLGRVNEGDPPGKILVSDATIKAMTQGYGYEHMFKSQAECIPDALLGKDIFVKAKTGHGMPLDSSYAAFQSVIVSEVYSM